MLTSSCPDCGSALRGKKCRCGWSPDGDKPRYYVMVGDAVVDTGCKYNDHGERCQKRGSVSSGTTGTGAWYCSEHFWRMHGRDDLAAQQNSPKPPKTGHVSETLEAMK